MTEDDEWHTAEQQRHNRDTYRRDHWNPKPRPVRFTDKQMAIAIAVAEKHETEKQNG